MQSIAANTLLRGLGTLVDNPVLTGVVTDSRAVKQGSLFVCIAGERVDGHAYAKQALSQGAAGILAQHAIVGVPAQKIVMVQNVLDAMIVLGGNYRAQFTPILTGVTGSVGKTTTKEFCFAVFSAFGETLKTQGNQNNEIGMPNTLLRMDDTTQYAVIEMGMQGLGEIEKLTKAARPCGAIITGIGVSHLEQLGTRENICKAKLEICDGMPSGAPLVLNGDDALLSNAKLRADLRPVLFAVHHKNADVVAEDICTDARGTRFTIADQEHGRLSAYIPALGEHNVMDALSAYALATRLGLDAKKCAAALSGYKTTGHRQNLVQCRGIAVFEDCYNASPDSMRAALITLRDYAVQGNRIAVLGDMFELGGATQSAHSSIGDLCRDCGVDLLITVGDA
ncbi:MAG: UDP-N-acetylmuramoyl-tripeptide--D-alanyl-D-alanine ligase, partial [Ruthenibacterium sp.]